MSSEPNDSEPSPLFEVAKAFLEIKELDDLKQQIVISSLGILGAKSGTLLEFDHRKNALVVAASLGQRFKANQDTAFPLRKKWLGYLTKESRGLPLCLSEIPLDPYLKSFVRSNRILLGTFEPEVVVPIYAGEELLGILCLQGKLLKKKYSKEDFDLLGSLTTLAAKAWGNLPSVKPREKTTSTRELVLSSLPTHKIKKELNSLRKEHPILQQIVGESRAILSIFRSILEVAKTKCPVLILGDTGTGKELVASSIHQLSTRLDGPFVELNCASVPSELIESELFGYEKGSFTGATGERKGIFQLANTGTLFLDEIGDMGLSLQTKLLRVIQEGRFRRIGGERNIDVDVRIVAASNKDLVRETKKGNFRADLLYRINVYPIYLPSLAERVEDIPLLAEHFLSQTSTEFGLPLKSFSSKALDLLMNYRYPGNIRELKNLVERVALRSGEQKLIDSFWLEDELRGRKREKFAFAEGYSDEEVADDPPPANRRRKPELIFQAEFCAEETEPTNTSNGLTLAEIEKTHIQRVLKMTQNNKTRSAKLLGIPRSTLIGKMRKLKMLQIRLLEDA